MDICFLTCICLWQISQIHTCLFTVVGPGLVSTSPSFVNSSASHPAGPHGRHAQKNGKSGPHCWGREGSTQFAQQFVTAPSLVCCVVWSLTALFNLSVTNCQIPAIWKSSLFIPIPMPGKDTSQGSSYRPISLFCPAAKFLETLTLSTINKYLLPAPDKHGFRQELWTTSALLQLTTDIAMGFNQRNPHDRTVCVALDLSAAFDTVFLTLLCGPQESRFRIWRIV